MRKTKTWKRLLCALLALCLFTAMPGTALAETISELEERNQQLDTENEELEKKLESLRADETEKKEYQAALQEKIDVVTEKINTAREEIDALNTKITELDLKLEKAEEQVQDTIAQFKKRLTALYKAGDVSTLEILLNSNSFSEFTNRSEMMRTMSERDQKMMDTIEEYMNSTKDEREEREESRKLVAERKKELEADQQELNGLFEENEALLAEIQALENSTQEEIDKNTEERQANDALMEELIQKQKEEEEKRRQEAAANGSSGNEYLGGNVSYPTGGGGVEGFNPIWPLPGVTYISATYGGYPGHRGLDIAGAWGTAVVAAESGTVIAANNYDSWGDSWGYYVLIYHNGTYTTRYAHLSSLAVSQGQYVEKGTIVGYEGATGNVTGPHLHFEVYENGTRVDPMNFL